MSTGTDVRIQAFSEACLITARLLLAPVDEDLARTVAENFPAAWPLTDPAGREAASQLQRVLSSDPAAAGNERERAWRSEWERMFRGHGESFVSPYESVHTTKDALVFGESSEQVRGWYADFGVTAPREGREPDDHIGLEINFLGLVLGAAHDADTHGDSELAHTFTNLAARFAHQHPVAWARDAIARPLETESGSRIYGPVGTLLMSVLNAADSLEP